jgi:hypothetical protein
VEVCVRVEEPTKVDFISLFIAVHLIKSLKPDMEYHITIFLGGGTK